MAETTTQAEINKTIKIKKRNMIKFIVTVKSDFSKVLNREISRENLLGACRMEDGKITTQEEKNDALYDKINEDKNENPDEDEDEENNENTNNGEENGKNELEIKKNEENVKNSHNVRRIIIQKKLLEEKSENKTVGIMDEDVRIISSFYKLSNNWYF